MATTPQAIDRHVRAVRHLVTRLIALLKALPQPVRAALKRETKLATTIPSICKELEKPARTSPSADPQTDCIGARANRKRIATDGPPLTIKAKNRLAKIAPNDTAAAASPVRKGKSVSIQWTGTSRRPWYDGTIVDHNPTTNEHLIKYDDGEQRWHDLADEEAHGQLRWL